LERRFPSRWSWAGSSRRKDDDDNDLDEDLDDLAEMMDEGIGLDDLDEIAEMNLTELSDSELDALAERLGMTGHDRAKTRPQNQGGPR
jgi:hypothetical protein